MSPRAAIRLLSLSSISLHHFASFQPPMRPILLATIAALANMIVMTTASSFCNALPPYTYTTAFDQFPWLQDSLSTMMQQPVATWYTDRFADSVDELMAKCADDAIPSIVVYGLPYKDCGAGGFSGDGANKDEWMYRRWIEALTDKIGDREAVLVLEPDAIGLLSTNGCAWDKGYLPNLKNALQIISERSPNAHVYVDVSTWADKDQAIWLLNELKQVGGLSGIAINTSNYISTWDLFRVCEEYSAATDGLHCVFDTSRNYNGSPHGEWCNARSAGVGIPPTTWVDHDLVDYFLWIKVPGESDGECNHNSATHDAMAGPPAGQFFVDAFQVMWDQGYFVQAQERSPISVNKTAC